MEKVLHFVFGIFGNATVLFLFLAPIVTFQIIVKNRSTEEFSGIPYNMTLLNCLLSAWYGLPFVLPNLFVWSIDGTGALIEAIYVMIFLAFAPVKAKMMGLLALVITVFTSAALISLLALHGETRKTFCGFAASVLHVCISIVCHGNLLSISYLFHVSTCNDQE